MKQKSTSELGYIKYYFLWKLHYRLLIFGLLGIQSMFQFINKISTHPSKKANGFGFKALSQSNSPS